MPKELYTNSVIGYLSVAALVGDTTFTVTDASIFPATGNFTLKCEQEIVLVTGVSGSVLTVSRGQEGTTAAAHAISAPIWPSLTAGALKRLHVVSHGGLIVGARREINLVDGGGVAWTVADDSGNERVDISAAAAAGFEGAYAKPLLSALTWDNQQNATAVDAANGVAMTCLQSATAGYRLLWKAIPATVANQYTAILRILPVHPSTPFCSVVLRDSVGGKYESYDFNYYSGGQRLTYQRGTALSGLTYQDYTDISGLGASGAQWVKIVEDATHRTMYISKDGVTWVQIYQFVNQAYLSPDGVGFAISPASDRNAVCTLLSLTITSP